MQQFKLTVVKQGRAVLAVLLFSLSILTGLYLAIILESTVLKIITPIASIMVINGLAICFAAGKLTIKTDGETLTFHWSKKWFFNFKAIDRVNLLDIDTIVIDALPGEAKEHLQYFTSNHKKINVSTPKYWRKDADAFIQYLKEHSNAEVKDSWDMLKEKGLISIPYYLISFILVAGFLLMLYVLFEKGLGTVEPQHLIMFIGAYLGLIPFWFIIRSKMKKTHTV
ncbi:hypothetical protein [Reichenbachiella ulvae]|uniref:PH domain-containing protein n=1 Tax=Reichenbachiella ulvae TaxID=2980104 RepID=A0ABT3CQL5_9BACT|nr:hypothetical protein [Reichenbachiella ulvae]MCV9385558.1 hypothetical protein [Reichenbachiella ulvae]